MAAVTRRRDGAAGMTAPHPKGVDPGATPTPLLQHCAIEEPALLALSPQTRRRLAWALVITLSTLFYLIPGLAIAMMVLATIGQYTAALSIGAILLVGVLVPVRPRPFTRKIPQLLYELYGVRHNGLPRRRALVEASVNDGDRYILGMHPHGVVPIQALVWAAFCEQYLRTPECGGVYGVGGMASVLFFLPGLRNILGWLSTTSASFQNLKGALSGTGDLQGHGADFRGKHPGLNVFMLPGGIAEIFTAEVGGHTIVWKARRGLCRLALVTGARLLPVYTFGGNDFFHQSNTADGVLSRMSRYLGVSVVFFWGERWWLPVPTIPMLPPHGLTIVMAEALPSRRTASPDGRPTDAEVDALHSEYEASLRAAFDEHKAAAGYPNAVLNVT